MKKILITLIVAVFALSIAGCGGGGEETPAADATADQKTEEDASAPKAPAPKTEEAASDKKPAPDAAAAPAAGGLDGTTWKVDVFEITFKGDSEILVKGGPLAAIMPDGATGSYKLDGSALDLSAMGKNFKGSWDGTVLKIDNAAAEKIVIDGAAAEKK
jgi:predicted small lipoprotein YifL